MNGALLLQAAGGLAAVLGLFALVVWLMRSLPWSPPRNAGGLRVTARIGLDARHTLVEVAHGGRRYLLAVSQAGVAQLDPARTLPEANADVSENRHTPEGTGAWE